MPASEPTAGGCMIGGPMPPVQLALGIVASAGCGAAGQSQPAGAGTAGGGMGGEARPQWAGRGRRGVAAPGSSALWACGPVSLPGLINLLLLMARFTSSLFPFTNVMNFEKSFPSSFWRASGSRKITNPNPRWFCHGVAPEPLFIGRIFCSQAFLTSANSLKMAYKSS